MWSMKQTISEGQTLLLMSTAIFIITSKIQDTRSFIYPSLKIKTIWSLQFKSLTEHWHNSSLGIQQYQSNKAVHSGGIPGSDQLDVSTSLPRWSLCYWSFMLSTGSTSLLWTCIKPTVKMNRIKNMLDAHTVTAGYYWNDNGSTLCSIVQQKMLT